MQINSCDHQCTCTETKTFHLDTILIPKNTFISKLIKYIIWEYYSPTSLKRFIKFMILFSKKYLCQKPNFQDLACKYLIGCVFPQVNIRICFHFNSSYETFQQNYLIHLMKVSHNEIWNKRNTRNRNYL